jgi:hypothetical protein
MQQEEEIKNGEIQTNKGKKEIKKIRKNGGGKLEKLTRERNKEIHLKKNKVISVTGHGGPYVSCEVRHHLRGFQFASELYRLSDRHLSANF